MNATQYTDVELLEAARYDAFHGVVVTALLTGDHPLQATLREHFAAILAALNLATPRQGVRMAAEAATEE